MLPKTIRQKQQKKVKTFYFFWMDSRSRQPIEMKVPRSQDSAGRSQVSGLSRKVAGEKDAALLNPQLRILYTMYCYTT